VEVTPSTQADEPSAWTDGGGGFPPAEGGNPIATGIIMAVVGITALLLADLLLGRWLDREEE
jgi:hypothetical protein